MYSASPASPSASSALPASPLAVPAPRPEVPADWTVREPTADDVDAVYDLYKRYEEALVERALVSREEIAADLAPASGTSDWRYRLVERPDGTLVAGMLVGEVHPDHFILDAAVDPAYVDELTMPMERAAVAWARSMAAAALAAQPDLEKVQLGAGCLEENAARRAALEALGLEQSRAFLQMYRPVTADETYVVPDGVRVRRASVDFGAPAADQPDAALMHHLVSTSFEDHHNYQRSDLETWWRRRTDDAGADGRLWFVASADVDGVDTPVGAMVMNRELEESEGSGYVHYLGVLREGRGRGVAKALLATAFATSRDAGLSGVALWVDAESPTGATRLYESVGMRARQVNLDYQTWVTR